MAILPAPKLVKHSWSHLRLGNEKWRRHCENYFNTLKISCQGVTVAHKTSSWLTLSFTIKLSVIQNTLRGLGPVIKLSKVSGPNDATKGDLLRMRAICLGHKDGGPESSPKYSRFQLNPRVGRCPECKVIIVELVAGR